MSTTGSNVQVGGPGLEALEDGAKPRRIHGTGIFTYIYHKNQPFNVDKYTSSFDRSYGNLYLEGEHPNFFIPMFWGILDVPKYLDVPGS